MTKIITINQLIEMFQTFSDKHFQLNDFGYGPTSEIGKSRDMKFPYLWITHSQSSTININSRNQTPILNLTFIIVDQINDQKNYLNINGNDSNNIQEIMSDTFQTIQDLIHYCLTELGKMGVKILEEQMNINPIMDETTDKVSGWSIDLTLQLMHLNCVTPITL